MPPDKVNLLDFDRQGLRDFFTQIGEKPYRAEQVMKWIYHDLEDNFENMTDVGKALRAKLTEATCYIGRAEDPVGQGAPPTARTSGCWAWTAATRSRRCTSPSRPAARCACPRRSAAR